MNKDKFNKLTKEQQESMMKEYLEGQIKMFIAGTSQLNEANATFKAKAVSAVLFFKLKEISKSREIPFSQLAKEMIEKGFSSYSGNISDYPSFFLKGLDYVSESEKLATQAENAWSNLLPRLPYMKETTSYNSTDTSLIYALDRITIKRVVQSQKCTDSITNTIDGYLLSGLKKDFIRFYNEAQKNGSDIMQIEGTGSVKVEIEAERKPKALLGGLNRPQLNEFNENVNNIAVGILEGWEERC